MRRTLVLGIIGSTYLLATSPVSAQQRPLVTEDPETVGAGAVLLEGGVDYARELVSTAYGLTGHLLRIPLGISIGVGPIAELQLDGGLYSRLQVIHRQPAPLSSMLTFQGDTTRSIEDLVVGTKIRIAGETPGRPAVGLRVATKLPNASNESGLGLDTLDFFGTFLIGKTIRSVRAVGNVGLGILSDPTRGDRQNDVLLYGVSLARAVAQGTEVVGEFNGRLDTRKGEPPPGTESSGTMRVGLRYTRGGGRIDTALLVGMTSRDPSLGFTAGFTYVFQASRVP